ncbi:Fe-S cluster assembly protein SufD [Aerococcus urinaeequi]|uniref:Fe-S cluster assembly protein SufD n=1 Tax=Aerococcus urinaeequi TaxID=51665 RepID=UPI003AADC037
MSEQFVNGQEIVEKISKTLNESDWFLNQRLSAYDSLKSLSKLEIERIDYSKWNLWNFPSENQKRESVNVKRADGVHILDFQTAFTEYGAFFEGIYKRSSFVQREDVFNAFTLAYLTRGIFIYAPENVQVNEPIELDFIQNNEATTVSHQQVLVYAGKNASIEINEKYATDSKHKMSIQGHVDFIAEEGSLIQYFALGQLAKETTAYIRRTGKTEKDARILLALGAMNDGNVIEDIQIQLKGQGSSSDVKTVAISHGQQVQMINVGLTNIGLNTDGNIFQHGVVLEQSTLSFNGIGHIIRGSKYSNAQQESRVLMLSDEARADANPILLIDEFEVQAGHAASVSRVDKEQLYYLMSRGLDQLQAEKLVILGFLGIVLKEISLPSVREQLIDRIERKLTHYGN